MMTASKPSLLKSTSIYTFSSLINSAIPFFLMPLLTRKLSTVDYGVFSMYSVLYSLIVPFIGLSLHGAIQRKYYEQETIDFSIYVSSCIFILIIFTGIFFIVFAIFAIPFGKLLGIPPDFIWLIVPVVAMQFLGQIILSLWQVESKSLRYGIFQIMQTIVNLSISIVLIIGFGYGWKGRIIGQFSAITLLGLIALTLLFKRGLIKPIIKIAYIREALKFGLPLIPHSIGGVVIMLFDRFAITKFIGLDATGIYSVGYQVGTLISILQVSFNQAYIPWLYGKLKNNKYSDKIKIVKITYLYFFGILSLAVLLGLLAPVLMSFYVGKEFSASSIHVLWISMGFAFNGMYKMVVNYIFYAERTSVLGGLTISSSLVNIILDLLLVPLLGAIGAGIAMCLTNLIFFMVIWYASSRIYPMPWRLGWKS